MVCAEFLTDEKLKEITARLPEKEHDLDANDPESDFDMDSMPILKAENIIASELKDVGEQDTRSKIDEQQSQGNLNGASENTAANLKEKYCLHENLKRNRENLSSWGDESLSSAILSWSTAYSFFKAFFMSLYYN